MNIIDSSGWLEYFADGPNASFFSHPLQKTVELIVPTITIYEVFKHVNISTACNPPSDFESFFAYLLPGLWSSSDVPEGS